MKKITLIKNKGFLIIFLFSLPALLLADIYQYKDSSGKVYLTDHKMRGNFKLVKHYRPWERRKRVPTVASSNWKEMALRKSRLTPSIEKAAAKYGLSVSLLHAVIEAESSYNKNAISKTGAVGLMQLMPGTAKMLGVSDRYDEYQNINGGAKYLNRLLSKFENNITLALAAYNAGENAVIRYGNQIPPYPETQRYVKKVLAFKKKNET